MTTATDGRLDCQKLGGRAGGGRTSAEWRFRKEGVIFCFSYCIIYGRRINMDNVSPAVPARIAELAAAFRRPEPMRRGSLYERRMKCGQAACACQRDPQAAHGPYFTLTQKVEGKTRSRYISPDQASVVRWQIESGRQFRERVEAYWEACEGWADEQLEAVPASAEEAEKGGSRPTWKAKSPRKSKRS
jgi:hypothetical protein